ncbi:MAG: serine/threonine-protein kinase [Polyangiales bacterium]
MTQTNANDAPPVTPRRVIRALGRYQLSKLLGEGAMGRVYLASDPELVRDVAIKVLRLDQAGSAKDAYIARFRNEARAAARFNHPNVVSVHDAGVDATLGPYLVYEYIPGSTLRATLDRGRLDTATLLRVVRGVAAALDALHAARIVHRDVKPDNILLAPDGRVKLTDFGIARVPDVALTRDGQFLGTPAYAAPEAIARGEYSHRGDLFSFAAVTFEALAGVRPFPGDDAVTVSYAVVNDTPKNPSTLANNIPVGVDDVFLRALSKEPEERHASAVEFADALAAALQPKAAPQVVRSTQPPIPLRTQTPRTVAKKPERQSIAPLVFAAAVVAGLGVVAARQFGRAPTPSPVASLTVEAPAEAAAPAPTPAPAVAPQTARQAPLRARVRRLTVPPVQVAHAPRGR